ncbi:Glycosyltransferase, GT2 family [Paenibacillaceae bacterium GAS479]|nr:Glycosyltransferase, GT2 family [Paenibacillaceae bacterium GAS479]
MKTSIIILTHNQLEYTLRCLDSINRHTEDYELILVDNGSTDGTAELLLKSSFKTVLNPGNEGFAKGCNQGLALAEGDTVLFLNNDVVVTPGWLTAMHRLLESEPLCGMVGPVSNYVSGPQQVHAGYGPGLAGLEAFAAERSRVWHGHFWELPRLVGFCLLLRRSLALELGGFDERYGLGNYEDDDLCMRVRNGGWRLLTACDSFIHHYGHVTMNSLEEFDLPKLLERNKAIANAKWGEDLVNLLYRKVPTLSCSVGTGDDADAESLNRTLNSIVGFADEIMLIHHGSDSGWETVRHVGQQRDIKTVRTNRGESAGAEAAIRQAGREYALWLRAGEVLSPEEGRRLLALRRKLTAGTALVSLQLSSGGTAARMALVAAMPVWNPEAGGYAVEAGASSGGAVEAPIMLSVSSSREGLP